MRKIYQKYFEIPEENEGIMGERVFFARLTVAIACIVLCMSAMGFSAYAFFTASVSSSMNQIQAASFDLEVQKIEPQTETASESYASEKTYKLQPGDYKFVLTKSGNATTGYCQIVLTPNDVTSKETNESVFYTKQFGKVEGQAEPVNTREITIKVGVATTVKFVPCWGTYVGEGVCAVNYAMDKKESTTTAQPENQSEPSEVKGTTSTEAATSTETTTPAGTTTPTETTNSTEPTNSTETASKTEESVLGNEDEKDDMVVESIEENNGTTTESAESAEDTTSLTEMEE